MNEYLLVGTRLPKTEVSPDAVARDVVASCAWQRALQRWGLLRSFAIGNGASADPTVCLLVHVSGSAAAQTLAVGWERVTGYLVTALELIEPQREGERPFRRAAGAAG